MKKSNKKTCMKKILIFGGVLLWLSPLSAQSLSPELVATSGKSYSSANSTMEYSLGEVVTSSLTDGSNQLTQGFHQPEIHFFSIEKETSEFTFSLYPNPTDQYVTVASTTEAELQVHIYAASGQAIEMSQVFTQQITLDLQTMVSGSYIMVITDASGNRLKNYTIIKK
jgi:hypothetical protein